MITDLMPEAVTKVPEVNPLGKVPMVSRERWEKIHRLALVERLPIAEIGRRLDLDRKTVRRCLGQASWRPYRQPPRSGTLLAEHAEYLRKRSQGKKAKQALIVVAVKLLHALYAMLRHRAPYNPSRGLVAAPVTRA